MKSSGTLLSLLVYLDGSTDSNILLGSTWSTEKLDKALLRPGRFDTILHFSFPEKADRNHILTLHASKHPFPELSPEISWTFFSGLTKSFLPADLVLLVETSYLETCSNYLKKRDNSATGETAQLVENTNQPVIEQANQTSKMPQHTMDSLMNALYSYKKQLKQSQLYF
jgi:ATP-dependent 26S proteasome regulatory subunit